MQSPDIHTLSRRAACMMLLMTLVQGASVFAQHAAHQGSSQSLCAQQHLPVSALCGAAPSLIFDDDGRLWASFESAGHVYVSYSDDTGERYSPPVVVNATAEAIYTDGENRPKIAIGSGGEIYVSWTQKTDGPYAGNVRFSRSTDGARSFEPVRTINDDGLLTSHRFDSLIVDRAGTVYLLWLDKRDREASLTRGEDYAGAATYYAISTNQGRDFQPNRRLHANSCECCRIAVAATEGEGIAVLWRQIFDGHIRDHAFATIDGDGNAGLVQRATHDNWAIDACPHHGPAIASAGKAVFHIAWFSASTTHKGIHYGRFDVRRSELADTRSISSAAGASHPALLSDGDHVLLAWKEFDGRQTRLELMTSDDGGQHWESTRTLFMTGGNSDHPQLIGGPRGYYFAWQTQHEGLLLRRIELPGETP